jgi:hypothetical protein
MKPTNRIKITRTRGMGTRLRVQLTVELDASDPGQLERLGKAIADLTPPEDRNALLADMAAAAEAAGILVSLQ